MTNAKVRSGFAPCLATLLTTLLAFGCAHEKAPVVAVGGVIFETKALDLGVASEGVDLRGEFPFRNTGRKALQITRVVASCLCTSIELQVGERRYLANKEGVEPAFVAVKTTAASDRERATQTIEVMPGQRGRVEVVVDTAGRRGANEGSVAVYTDATAGSVVGLRFRTLIRPFHELRPPEVVLSHLRWDQRAGFRCSVMRTDHEGFLILGVEGASRAVSCDWKASGGGWVVTGRIDPMIWKAAPSTRLILRTNLRKRPVRVPLIVKVKPVLEVKPGRFVSLGKFPRDVGTRQPVQIKALDGRELRITGVELVRSSCARRLIALQPVAVGSAPDRQVLRYALLLRPGIQARVVSAEYRLRTNHPFESEISLRVLGLPQSER